MKIIIYYVVFVIAYIALVTTTAMFFMTWGAKRKTLETAYVFFLSKPFDWSISMWLLPLNAVFWATAFYLIAIGIKRFNRNKL